MCTHTCTHTQAHSCIHIHMQKLQKDWEKVEHFDMHLNGIISIRCWGHQMRRLGKRETTTTTGNKGNWN